MPRTASNPSSTSADSRSELRRAQLLYTISTKVDAFGEVLSFHDTITPGSSRPELGRRCFEVVYGRSAACAGCPARGLAATAQPRDAIFRGPRLDSPRPSRTGAITAGVSAPAQTRVVGSVLAPTAPAPAGTGAVTVTPGS